MGFGRGVRVFGIHKPQFLVKPFVELGGGDILIYIFDLSLDLGGLLA